VKKIWLLGIALLGVGLSLGMQMWSISVPIPTVSQLLSNPNRPVPTVASPTPSTLPTPEIQYQTHSLPHSVVHTLLIPAQHPFQVIPAIADGLDTLEQFAQNHGAIAVINGGFFDPANQLSTSYVIVQGQLVADPRDNERLVTNPNLSPYLEQIFNRSEFRRYQCGQSSQYAIARHADLPPPGCELVDALGGGPRLLPALTAQQEAFWDTANGQVTRDPLGRDRPNARTAVGLTVSGDVVLVMVAQQPEAPATSGMSLVELANFMTTLGVTDALNLDGGSSSSFYYKGTTIYGKVDDTGASVRRSVKSVLMIVRYSDRQES
jgi:Phosphodiester glycosidase